ALEKEPALGGQGEGQGGGGQEQAPEAQGRQPDEHGDAGGDQPRHQQQCGDGPVMGVDPGGRVRPDAEKGEVSEGGLPGPAREQGQRQADDGEGDDQYQGLGLLLGVQPGEDGRDEADQGQRRPAVAAQVPGHRDLGQAGRQGGAGPLGGQQVVAPAGGPTQRPPSQGDGHQQEGGHRDVGHAAAVEVVEGDLLDDAEEDPGAEGEAEVGHARQEGGGQAPHQQAGADPGEVDGRRRGSL